MNLQKIYEPKTLPAPTKADKELAHELHAKILAIIDSSKVAEAELEHNYITLGKHIYRMQVKTLWIPLGYDSWRDYFAFLQDKFGMGRTQLYGYVGCVKTLSPYVDDDTLVDMGVSKAKELKRAVDTTSKAPSEELLEKARDPKVLVPEFRKMVQDEFHIIDHNEKGIWRDFGGCYLTEDEVKLVDKAFELARGIDPVISNSIAASSQFKEILVRLCEEFINSNPEEQEPDFWTENKNFSKKPDIEGFNEVFDGMNAD